MSFASKVLYTGDGVIYQYNIPFPFIDVTHVSVYVNQVLQLDPMHYTISGSTVTFDSIPAIDDAIEIKRGTSPTVTLVDFVDGSTLGANELDTAYLHNFYLSQEYADSFNEIINNALISIASGAGIVETDTDLVIAALVNEMLDQAAAATLQQRVVDIDNNAEAILTLGQGLQVQINTLAQGVAAVVYVQPGEPIPGVAGIPDPIVDGARWYDSDDNNKPYLYDQALVAWLSLEDPRIGQAVADITVLQTNVSDNAAAVVTEATARSNSDIATASLLSLIGAQNGAQTAFIINTSTVKIDSDVGDTFAFRFNALATTDSNISASVTSEESARIAADGAAAAVVSAIDARLTTGEGNIITNAAAVVTEANARVSGDGANASAITVVDAKVDLKSQTFSQATPPTATNTGDLWVETDNNNKLWRWSGTAWQSIQDAGIVANANSITSTNANVTTNANGIAAHTGQISTLQSDVTTLDGALTASNVTIAANTAAIVSNDGDISSQASLISTLQSDVTTVDGRVDTANVTISANTAAIVSNDGDLTTLYAKYGVTLNVNGHITGFATNNDGETGSFVVLADKFAIVTPSTVWAATTAYALGDMIRPVTPTTPSRVFKCTTAGTSGGSQPLWNTTVSGTTADGTVVWTTFDDAAITPFLIDGSTITLTGDVIINGSLITAGSLIGSQLLAGTIGSTQIGANAITTTQLNANSVNASKIVAGSITATEVSFGKLSTLNADIGQITAGDITLDSAGFIKAGQTAYNTGTGFFLGYDTAAYKFSIGDGGTANFISWDGTSLVIRGNISVGSYTASDNVLLAATTTRTSLDEHSYNEIKKFEINRPGTARLTYTVELATIAGGLVAAGSVRVKVDGTTQWTDSVSTTSPVAKSHDVTLDGNSQYITIEVQSGQHNTGEPVESTLSLKLCNLKADKSDGEAVITD